MVKNPKSFVPGRQKTAPVCYLKPKITAIHLLLLGPRHLLTWPALAHASSLKDLSSLVPLGTHIVLQVQILTLILRSHFKSLFLREALPDFSAHIIPGIPICTVYPV